MYGSKPLHELIFLINCQEEKKSKQFLIREAEALNRQLGFFLSILSISILKPSFPFDVQDNLNHK